MTSKEAFLANISKRLGRTTIEPPTDSKIEGPPDFWRAHRLSQSERVKKFLSEVEELGAKASTYSSHDTLLEDVKRLLMDLQPPSILTWNGEFQAKWRLDQVLSDWKVVKRDHSSFLQNALQAKVGITAVDYAIAETGSLVLCTSKSKVRVASLVPDVHIALVRSDQIKTQMGEVLEELSLLQGDEIPSSIHFITGPSRSSDIENDLSIGVHGPAALHVLVLETS
jgi:L-lactate dehydrogenase complex protein LldG